VANFVSNFLKLIFGKKLKPGAAGKTGRPFMEEATAPLPDSLSQQLPPDSLVKGMEAEAALDRLGIGIGQDVGQVRDHNEDTLLAISAELGGLETMPDFALLIVADGMGGHSAGERASAVAARAMAKSVMDQMLPSLLADAHAEVERPILTDVMKDAVVAANEAVVRGVPDGGTTLTSALVLGEQLVIAHVGDSRAYFITPSSFEAATRDHSLVQRLRELGQITEEEALVHPQRSVLYRALGQGETLDDVDIISRRLPPGGMLMLCSDGLWSLVPDHQMRQIVRHAPSLQAACKALVEAANAAGGPDNISVILARLPD
jgi:PPM family protein phosphatase